MPPARRFSFLLKLPLFFLLFAPRLALAEGPKQAFPGLNEPYDLKAYPLTPDQIKQLGDKWKVDGDSITVQGKAPTYKDVLDALQKSLTPEYIAAIKSKAEAANLLELAALGEAAGKNYFTPDMILALATVLDPNHGIKADIPKLAQKARELAAAEPARTRSAAPDKSPVGVEPDKTTFLLVGPFGASRRETNEKGEPIDVRYRSIHSATAVYSEPLNDGSGKWRVLILSQNSDNMKGARVFAYDGKTEKPKIDINNGVTTPAGFKEYTISRYFQIDKKDSSLAVAEVIMDGPVPISPLAPLKPGKDSLKEARQAGYTREGDKDVSTYRFNIQPIELLETKDANSHASPTRTDDAKGGGAVFNGKSQVMGVASGVGKDNKNLVATPEAMKNILARIGLVYPEFGGYATVSKGGLTLPNFDGAKNRPGLEDSPPNPVNAGGSYGPGGGAPQGQGGNGQAAAAQNGGGGGLAAEDEKPRRRRGLFGCGAPAAPAAVEEGQAQAADGRPVPYDAGGPGLWLAALPLARLLRRARLPLAWRRK